VKKGSVEAPFILNVTEVSVVETNLFGVVGHEKIQEKEGLGVG
jgi:hypothetical protein